MLCAAIFIYNGVNPLKAFFSINLSLPGAYPEIWIGEGREEVGSRPLPFP